MPDVATAPKRTRHRSPESQADFKRRLLDRARQIYLERGFEGLSIRTLTDGFQMSAMSFYGYFDSKHDLVRHIWLDFFQELLALLLAAGEGKRSPTQVLAAHIRTYVEYWETHPDRYRLVYMTDCQPNEDGGRMQVSDHPVYQQLGYLARERVKACAKGRPLTDRTVRVQCDLMLAKAVGYLHLTIALQRYPSLDREVLKKALVKDIVDSVVAASEG